MKKIKYLLFLILCAFISCNVYANSIEKITMDIYVDKNGDAHIKEEWIASIHSGTEGYKSYGNLGTSEIKDFNVKMNGRYFYKEYNWDVDASFEDKEYKSGLNKNGDEVELCFGISEYGRNTYLLEYTITNFVVSTEDKDMIYWTLLPEDLKPKPSYVYIKIYSDFNYDYETPVWGYGNYGGYTYVHKDGYIEMISEDKLKSDEYMVLLAEFPKGTFNTKTTLDENFNYYYEMAEKGATAYSDKFNFLEFILSIIVGIINMIFDLIIPIIFIILTIKYSSKSNYGTKKLKFSKGAKKLKDVPYFRNIPCNKDIFKAYWVACNYNLMKNKTDFLGAILLKWLKNKNIENVMVTSKVLKKEEKALKLINTNGLSNYEIDLYNMMDAASKDGVLEKNEFTKWCKKNYSRILEWFSDVIDKETMNFVDEGLITKEKKTYYVSDNMKNTAIEMAGLKKFLNEFSNIKERESIEVNLWEEYLMYAQIFGIAKKVAKEFKELYSDVIPDDYYDDFVFIHSISYSGVSAASTAKSRAESYSSGGGGFSSGGGGGGSFGGGGGGGFR